MNTSLSSITCEAPVFFATTEGQTERIAKYIAAVLRDQGFGSRAIAVTDPDVVRLDWSSVQVAALGASLHGGTHQPEAAAFVRQHADHLNERPSVFFSVSLSAASRFPETRAAARQLAEAFPPANGWSSACVRCIAGRLAYTKYGFLTRTILKWIVRKEGAPTDTSRDHEFTDWNDADAVAEAMAAALRARRNRQGRQTAA